MADVLLVNYDNGSHIAQPPHGLAYLASALVNAGHNVDVWDAGVTHEPADKLREHINATKPSVVAASVIGGYWQHAQLLALSKAVNASQHRDRLWYVIGGHGPASAPEYFRKVTGADTVFSGEGEVTFPALCSAKDRPQFAHGETVDVDAVAWPAWDLFDMSVYRLQRYPKTLPTDFAMPVLSGRGCTYKCSFCFRHVPGFRARQPAAVADEIAWLQSAHNMTYVNFDDELLMSGPKRTRDLCEAIGPLGIRWMCNGRLDVAAKHPDLLPLMRDAGATFINYGVESLSQPVLDAMNKRLTVEQIHAGVRATLDAGLSPGLNVMWGCPNDTVESLRMLVGFLREYDDGAQIRSIRPVTPYPGSPLFDLAVREGRIKDAEDFYVRHVNSDLASVQWTGLDDDAFHSALYDANADLVEYGCERIEADRKRQLSKLYHERDASWRGFRHT